MMKNPCDPEEEPSSRRKKLKLSSSSSSSSSPKKGELLSLLPDELFLSCLARVSRSDYGSLSLVSKWHRSLMFSPELYNFRTLLGCTEKRIYLCLHIPTDPNPRWFTLSFNRRRLIPVRSYMYQPPEASAMVSHGCGIYVMGGRIGGKASSSSVLYMDCRNHTWSTLPSMGVARYSAVAGVVDGKIYVLGGCDENSPKWGEVFDPKKQTWHALPMPPPPCNFPSVCESMVIEEEEKKVLVAINGLGRCLSYTPSENKWKKGFRDISGVKRGWHVIDNIVYCSRSGGRILWCEPPPPRELELELEWEWREVTGLEALRTTLAASKLVNYGGWLWDQWEKCRRQEDMLALGLGRLEVDEIFPGHKLSNSGPNMLLFWDVLLPHKLEVWCAEISLERHKARGEIRGNILWSQPVLTLDPPPPPSHQHHCKILHTLPLNL